MKTIKFLLAILLSIAVVAYGGGYGGSMDGSSTPAIYSISGMVSHSGKALQGTTITLTGPPRRTSTTTNMSGNYNFTGLANGDFVVTPSWPGYTFIPTSRAVTINGANVTGQDFTS
jgi:Carboxypeptidase regulatory-like domain